MAAKRRGALERYRDVARNRRARFDYEILDRLEAGLALLGSEVKAMRERGAAIGEAFIEVRGGEAWLVGAHVPDYVNASMQGHEMRRRRKLLLHRREIERLAEATSQRGLSIVPLRLYFNEAGRAKLEIGIGRGKAKGDKRQAIKEREARREADRAMKSARRH
jgi:SsrA-binding protein